MSVALKPIAELASSYAPRASLYAAPHDNVSDDSLSESDHSVGFHDDLIASSLVKKPAATEVSEAEAEAASEAPELTEEEQIERLSESMLSMPLAEIDAMRHTSAVAEAAANRVAPTPLGTPDVAFVRWVPEELHTAVPSHATTKRGNILPPTFSWRCLSCGEVATGPRECQHCRTPIAVGACRVFLGQVRKDLTAEMVTAMLRSLAPDVTILHIESHTNGTDGRGKGCAWAYVNSVEDAVRVTALHKRVFVDLDADKKEGFWFAKDLALRERLIAFADVIGAAGHRPAVFPRQPLVAELPAKSMLARYVQSAYPRAGQQ